MKRGVNPDGTLADTRVREGADAGKSLYPSYDIEAAARKLVEKYTPARATGAKGGPMPEPIRMLADKGATLLVTVDCGTTSLEQRIAPNTFSSRSAMIERRWLSRSARVIAAGLSASKESVYGQIRTRCPAENSIDSPPSTSVSPSANPLMA